MFYSFADSLGQPIGSVFKCEGTSCPFVDVSTLCESCSSANCQQYICFGKIMTGCHGCQAAEDAFWEIERGLINCSSDVFTYFGHRGALLCKLQGFGEIYFCVQLFGPTSFTCRHESHLTINASSDGHIQTHLQFSYWHRCVVCGMCILTSCLVCVVFSCRGLSGTHRAVSVDHH